MQPTPGDAHVNQPLTNLSVAHVQAETGFIADKVFPTVPVSKKSDVYYSYDRGYFNRDEMKQRAPGTEAAGSGYSVDATNSYTCLRYGFKHDIPDELRTNADSPLQLDKEAMVLVTQKALIKREKLWVSKFFTTGKWGTDLAGVAAAPGAGQFLQFNDAASTPIELVRARKTAMLEDTGVLANTLVLGQRVWDAIVDHPDFVDRIKYGQTPGGPAIISMQAVAALFEVERILVMRAIENTAAEGAANAHSFIGGKHMLLCYAAPSPGLMTPSAGYTFSWTGFLGASGIGHRIRKYRVETLESDRVEVDMYLDQKVISSALGCFFSAAVA